MGGWRGGKHVSHEAVVAKRSNRDSERRQTRLTGCLADGSGTRPVSDLPGGIVRTECAGRDQFLWGGGDVRINAGIRGDDGPGGKSRGNAIGRAELCALPTRRGGKPCTMYCLVLHPAGEHVRF